MVIKLAHSAGVLKAQELRNKPSENKKKSETNTHNRYFVLYVTQSETGEVAHLNVFSQDWPSSVSLAVF